jgi:sugar lactone lactonase YvrE
LWVTDIDAVWVFDTQNRRGRKLALPGAEFANDVALAGETLYVSDNRLDTVFAVTPADFLDDAVTPTIVQRATGRSINPNGVYPAADGTLLLAGMGGSGESRGIYALATDGGVTSVTEGLGRLDGLYEMADGTLLTTDWASAALLAWDEERGRQVLATDFQGPADLCALRTGDELLVVVPDLVKGELRLLRLR